MDTRLLLPAWMESTGRWRQQLNAPELTRLDTTISRHARQYRELHGRAHYREAAVTAPHGLADVKAAVDAALAATGRRWTGTDVTGLIDTEQEIRWSADKSRPVVLVYLTLPRSGAADRPDFALLFEPK